MGKVNIPIEVLSTDGFVNHIINMCRKQTNITDTPVVKKLSVERVLKVKIID